jgi:hypothetical protein
MAGANNRSLKAAGFKPAAIKVLRSTGGRGLSLQSAIAAAQNHGVEVPQRVHDFLAKRDAKAAAKSGAAERVRQAAEAHAKAREEARAIYERGNAAAGGKLASMRADIRGLIREARAADKAHTLAEAAAGSRASKTLGPMPKSGKKLDAYLAKKTAIENSDPEVMKARAQRAEIRTQLQRALMSRDATAQARSRQRAAEAAGQMDLFSGAPAPRAPSPFERRMALRDARVAMVGRLGQSMMAARKSGEVAKRQAETKAKKEAQRQKDIAATDAWWKKMGEEHAAKQAAAERQAAAVKRTAPGLRLASANMMAARRQVAAANAARAGEVERARTAAVAAAVDRGAGASRVGKYKVEKNATVQVAVSGAEGIKKVPAKAVVKAGDMAVVKGRYGYNVTHLPTGLTVNSSLPKNVAIQAVQGMASGRGAKAMTAKLAAWEKGGEPMSPKVARTARAVERYMQVANKRGAAYELQSARDAHARATAGGNPTVIKAATTRLNDAEKAHKRAIEHAKSLRRRGG